MHSVTRLAATTMHSLLGKLVESSKSVLTKWWAALGLVLLLESTVHITMINHHTYHPSSFLLVSANSVPVLHRRSPMHTFHQPLCSTQNDCPFDNSYCNETHKKCRCRNNFIQIGRFVNKSYISNLAMTCVQVALLDNRCISDHQCIVDHSECVLSTTTNHDNTPHNQTSHVCKCIHGYNRDNKTSDVIVNNRALRVHHICSSGRLGRTSWISSLVLISLLVLFILMGTAFAIFRYQQWRNQPCNSTVTNLVAGGMNQQGMGQNRTGTGSPPPMGSVEAEFENDFIQVFPMHHLEPMPDKNVHAFMK